MVVDYIFFLLCISENGLFKYTSKCSAFILWLGSEKSKRIRWCDNITTHWNWFGNGNGRISTRSSYLHEQNQQFVSLHIDKKKQITKKVEIPSNYVKRFEYLIDLNWTNLDARWMVKYIEIALKSISQNTKSKGFKIHLLVINGRRWQQQIEQMSLRMVMMAVIDRNTVAMEQS